MRINLEFAELHTPLFLGGRNFGLKLDKVRFGGLVIIYDQTEKELWVTHNDKTAIIPTSNVVSMTPDMGKKELEEGPKPLAVPEEPRPRGRPKFNSQVSTPTSHVFGEGPGRTND